MSDERIQEIKTMAVFVVEDKDICKSILQDMQDGYHIAIPARLNSYSKGLAHAVINISFDNGKRVFEKHKLSFFVFTHLTEDDEMCSELWGKENVYVPYNKRNNPYVKKEETGEWIDESGKKDRYTVIGNMFQYSVSASMFEAVRTMICERLAQIEVSEGKRGRSVDANGLLDFSIFRVGMAAYLTRQAINKNIINKINQHGSY